jgi:hypothetical protein
MCRLQDSGVGGADRDPHGYGFTRGFVATGPTVTGAVPDLDTRVQTAPVAAVSRYTVSDTLTVPRRLFVHRS